MTPDNPNGGNQTAVTGSPNSVSHTVTAGCETVCKCLGNICRSPLAEGIFRHQAEISGLADRFEVDSAGTGAYHTGEPADSRSIAVAAAHGIRLTGTARQVTVNDFEQFDVIVAMDGSNRRSLRRRRDGRARIVMMRDYDPEAGDGDVPDPYYGGSDGFERVYRILERACEGLLDELTDPNR